MIGGTPTMIAGFSGPGMLQNQQPQLLAYD
jgi:hypothetical protein